MPVILVIGANGQLGRSLQAIAGARPTQARYRFATREDLDITDEASIGRWLDHHPADCLINAAAYTAVDRATQEPALANAVNTRAPAMLARACARRSLRFFHVSTDYVFDGRLERPYREDDPPAPLNTYGRGKLAGEREVLDHCPHAVIVRTSWVFSAWGHNFVRTMLKLGQEHPQLQVVADQVGGPTWAGHLAAALLALALRPAVETPGGLYHFGGRPWVSWCDFASEIFRQACALGLLARAPTVVPIPASEWPTPEPRPANSRLDCGKLESLLGPLEADWRTGLDGVLRTLKAQTA
ncbi:dTDP-4-dehydrorhamnose reductase OS=Castellaniella defragrans OX=75697 GN=HNR28_002128 PE=3 SV=1 [Castellaniella defragrans]